MTGLGYEPSEAVRRVLARDDLLMMAADADQAVGIVRQREALSRLSMDEKSLFSSALEHYLGVAESELEGWATRAQAWRHAGVIVRFCEMVGIPVEMPPDRKYTSVDLHRNSLRTLEFDDPEAPPRDLTLHPFHRYRAARDFRLLRRFEEAEGLANVKRDTLNAGGAEPSNAHLLFELGAVYIREGQAAVVESLLREWDSYWKGRAAAFSTRYRVDFIRALAQWEAEEFGTDTMRALAGLETALLRVRGEAVPDASDPHGRTGRPRPEPGVEELSVTLAKAEYLALRGSGERDHAEAVRLGRRALRIANDVRGRWRVIARSRAPLAVVFQRVYGDIALLAASLPCPAAAQLGLRVALSAKQTGFAARIRTGRTLMSSRVEGIIDDIIAAEAAADDAESGRADAKPGSERKTPAQLKFELQEAVSPMLADTVLPPPTDLSALTEVIGGRHALDYLELTGTLGGPSHLFHTLIHPDGRIAFRRFAPDPYYQRFFQTARAEGDLSARLRYVLGRDGSDRDLLPVASHAAGEHEPGRFDWLDLAQNVLPEDLIAELGSPSDRPVELLISAHSWLSLVPWPALAIPQDDGGRVRLVERAIITQTPVFTCLQHEQPPVVTGKALIRLVGKDEDGVDVTEERRSWGLPAVTDGQPLSDCAISGGDAPVHCVEDLVEALRDGQRWDFLHIASHGGGQGLEQHLMIGDDVLSFGRALALRWPASVLMASCHVGQVINATEAEPLNFVMAMLSGRARCVVAGIAAIDDAGTGKAASHIVRAIRGGRVSLDVALRDAQLAAVGRGAPEGEWALLAAYTQ